MVRVLTKEEAIESRIKSEEEIAEWWDSIGYYDKKKIFDYHKVSIKQSNCRHYDSRVLDSYDRKIVQCGDCDYVISEDKFLVIERNDKITSILKK